MGDQNQLSNAAMEKGKSRLVHYRGSRAERMRWQDVSCQERAVCSETDTHPSWSHDGIMCVF